MWSCHWDSSFSNMCEHLPMSLKNIHKSFNAWMVFHWDINWLNMDVLLCSCTTFDMSIQELISVSLAFDYYKYCDEHVYTFVFMHNRLFFFFRISYYTLTWQTYWLSGSRIWKKLRFLDLSRRVTHSPETSWQFTLSSTVWERALSYAISNSEDSLYFHLCRWL